MKKIAIIFLGLFSLITSAQTLTMSDSGETGTSGTNWTTTGTNPVTISATGNASINTSVIEGYLNTGVSVLVRSTDGVITQAGDIEKTAGGDATLTIRSEGFGRINNTANYVSISGKLNLVFWSDYNNTNGGGSTFGSTVSSIDTNGGHIWVGGSSTPTGTSIWNGLTVGNGPSVDASGSNQNALDFHSVDLNTGGGDALFWAGNGTGGGLAGIEPHTSSTISTGSGDIILISDNFDSVGALTLNTTGQLVLAPNGGSYSGTITWQHGGGTNLNMSSTFDDLTINNIASVSGLSLGFYDGMSGVTINNSSPVTVNSTVEITGSITIYGNHIYLYKSLQSTEFNTDIAVISHGTGTGSDNGYIVLENDTNLTTNGGDIILWSNAANRTSGTANNEIVIRNTNTLSTSGGRIVLAGGLDEGGNGGTAGDGIPDGYAYRGGYGGSAIDIGSNVNLLSAGGDIIIRGQADSNLGGAVNNRGFGVGAGTALVVNSGTGTIVVDGKNASDHALHLSYGNFAMTSASITTPAVSIKGETTNNSSGILVNFEAGSGATLIQSTASTGGGITFEGKSAGNANNAITLGDGDPTSTLQILSNAGDIDFIANGIVKLTNQAVFMGNRIDATPVQGITPAVTASASNILMRVNGVEESNSWRFHFDTTGSFTYEPFDTAFNSAQVGGQMDFSGTLSADTFTGTGDAFWLRIFNVSSLTGLTFGKEGMTSSVHAYTEWSINGPIAMYGDNITIEKALTSTASETDILLKGNGNIRILESSALQTNKGDITFWADSDATGTGYVQLFTGTSIVTSGGDINMGGGSNFLTNYAKGVGTIGNTETLDKETEPALNLGISGVHFRAGVTINSGGGNITLNGENSGNSEAVISTGVYLNNAILNAGVGKIAINGKATGTGDINAQAIITSEATLTSSNTDADAIVFVGDATGVNSDQTTLGVNFNGTILAPAGGGVSISGKAGTGVAYDKSALFEGAILANSGAITLTGENDGADVGLSIGALTIGSKASTSITSSSSNISIIANNLELTGPTAIDASGTVSIQPFNDDFTSTFTLENLTFSGNETGLTIGKSASSADGTTDANITISSATTIAGPISVYGGEITIDANLSSTATTGDGIIIQGNKIRQDNDIDVSSSGSNITYAVENGVATAGTDRLIKLLGSADVASINANGGNISLSASFAVGGTAGDSDRAIEFNKSEILTSGTGTVSVIGNASNNPNTVTTSWGLQVYNSKIRSASGDITLTMTGGAASNNSRGLALDNSSMQLLSTSGTITIRDLEPAGLTGAYTGLYLRPNAANTILFGANGAEVASSSSDIVIEANRATFDVQPTRFNTSGTLTIRPVGAIFGAGISTANVNVESTATGFTLGKPGNSSALTFARASTINGPIKVYGGDIAINESLNTTADGAAGNILLKASGNIVQAAGKSITTSGADITLWSNSDDETTNGGYIYLQDNTSLDTRTSSDRTANDGTANDTSGGAITLGGGSGTTVPTGYALNISNSFRGGINLGTESGIGARHDSNITIISGGGNISLKGRQTSVFNGDAAGINAYEGFILDAGQTGNIALEGNVSGSDASISDGMNLGNYATTAGGTASSIRTVDGDITLTGSASDATAQSRGLTLAGGGAGLFIQSTGTGNINLLGTPGGTGTQYNILLIGANILANSGDINLTGASTGKIFNANFGSTIGYKSGSDVISSTSDITVTGDDFDLSSGFNFNTAGTLAIESFGNSFTNTFNTSQLTYSSDLTGLTIGKSTNTSTVIVGSATSIAGPITIYGGDIGLNAALTATDSNLNVHATGSVTQSAAITADNLALFGTGSFALQNSSNDIGVLAGGDATTRLGDIAYRDANALEIGTVNPTGIFSSGTVLVETETGNLTLSESINTTSTSDDAIILNAGRAEDIGTGTGGDIIVSGSPILTYGAGGRAKLFSGLQSTSMGLTALAGSATNVRSGVDETTANFSPMLADDNIYALYRVVEEEGDIIVVTAGGDAVNTTWIYSDGVITPISLLAQINVSDVEGKLNSGAITLAAKDVTINGEITNVANNAFTINATDQFTLVADTSLSGPISITAEDAILNADLTSTNSASGDIGFVVGTLTGSGNLALATSRDLTITQTGTSNFSGIISGTGSLTKSGNGELALLAANTYSEGTIINAGILSGGEAVETRTAFGSGDIQIETGAMLKSDRVVLSNNLVLNGGILRGTNGFGEVWNGTVSITANSIIENNFDLSFGGAVSGAGDINKREDFRAGNLILLGSNTHSGSLTVSNGAVLVGNGGTTGQLGSGAIVNNGTVIFNRSDDFTVNNAISGIGGITQEGAGSTTLTNNCTYTGATIVSSGALILENDSPTFASSGFGGVGQLRIQPSSDDFTGVFTTAGWNFESTLGGLTIGKASSSDGASDQNVTLNSAITVAGPITVYGGAITVNGALTATDSNLNLHATGAVTQSAAITADNLALFGTGSFALQNSANNIGVLAGGDATTRLGIIAYRDADALEIGSVNPDGLYSSETILVETENGDLTLSQNINTTSTSDDAIILNAGTASAAGTATGGDIIVSGTPTLTTGSGGISKLFSGSNANSPGLTALVGASNARYDLDETFDLSGESLTGDNAYAIYRAVGNTAPTVISTSITSATAQSLYYYDIKASDADNDVITWTANTVPAWLTFTSGTLQTSFVGTGADPTNTGDGVNQSSDGTSASSAVIRTNTAAYGDNKLFFTDTEEFGIRYVDVNGNVQTWYQGDGTFTNLNPLGIAYDAVNDAVYVGDYAKTDIVKIDNTGTRTLLSNLPEPFMLRLLVNSNGSKLYASARGGIYEIDLANNDPDANWTRVVGTGSSGYSDTGTASTSQVDQPHGMAFDSEGRLVFTDRFNDIIRRVNLATDTIETIAGTQGAGTETGDGGPAVNATFDDPSGLVINGQGEIFISERLSKRIRKIDTNGDIDTFFTVASGGFADDLVISDAGELYLLTTNLVAQVASKAELNGTPTNADAGVHDVALTLSDGIFNVPYNFQITVQALNAAPTDITLDNNSINQSATGIDSTVGTLSTTDADSGDSHTYSLVAGTGDDDIASFNIDASSLRTNNALSPGSYSVRINTNDGTDDFAKAFTVTVIDDTAPDGYTVTIDQDPTDSSNQTSISFTFAGAEIGTTYNYSFSSDNGVTTVTGSGTITSSTDQITAIDLSGLADGLITLTVTLTDSSANEGIPVQDSATKDIDQDNDGISDANDNCPSIANADQLDTDNDGDGDECDTDDDNDGTPDTEDAFPLDPNEDTDTDGDGTGDNADTDDDNDGIPDTEDNFPLGGDLDTDGDGTPDNVDTDDDNDGIPDTEDAFPLDEDEDTDTDGDGTGNNADTDDDNDGIPDNEDDFPLNPDEDTDTDGDGTGDNADNDDDDDGTQDSEDDFPLDSAEDTDTDGDGIGNNADEDDDNDGIEDSEDTNPLEVDDTEEIPTEETVIPAEALTPNGDGVNDTWVIPGIENYPNNVVRVYNRSGHKVFETVTYQNDWGGFYKGNRERLPAGSYLFIVDLGNGSAPIQGWVYLNY